HTDYLRVGDGHDELRGFWAWYEAQNVGAQAQIVGPLLYKLRAFLLRPNVRKVVDAPTSTLDLRRVLDGGLLLVRVPKGLLGEDTARLLGSFVVGKTWQAATGRAALGETARCDAALYVDECQNFLNLPRSFDEILSEARGFRLSLVLAHQHLGQLPHELRDAVSSNARNKVWFTMSPEDAHILERHTRPRLTEHDLANLDAYQAAVRLVVDGQDQPAFTLRTRPLQPAQPSGARP
ncbi:MAG: type VI secretion protein, partial [Mycobacteriales bacterium]